MEEIVNEEEEPPGGTPFFRTNKIEKTFHLKNVFFKFEGASFTGTQKDRISKLHVARARSLGYDTISLATCGNYGASMSHFSSMFGLKSVIGTPEYYAREREEEMKFNGSVVIERPAKYEEIVEEMRSLSKNNHWYDSSPGSENSFIDIMGYESIAYEIFEQLGHAPGFIAVPVGNGTTLAGIYSGFKKLYRSGKIKKIPRFIASSTANGNPIIASWKKKKKTIMTLNPNKIRETPINEPLIAYKSFDGQKALDAIYDSDGLAFYVTDEEMVRYSGIIEKNEMISVLPASASALAAVVKASKHVGKDHEFVIVITGRDNKLWTTQ